MKAVHATFPARFQPTVLSRCVTAVLLTALGTASHAALAPTPYPSLPQYSATSVTPNIMLFIDNSGSMAANDIPLSGGGTGTRMSVAKTVAKDLINNNKTLNWGLAAFNPSNNTTAGVIRQVIKSRSVAADQTAINNSIDGLNPDTWTPLAEAYYEMTRYWRGMNTFYWTGGTPATSITPISPYTRPITLRCQKNFTIVLTDGEPTQDATFPTSGQDSLKTGYPGNELYDYSKMMYTEDILNTTATDADGVSFNDPNYLKQNLVTYTVGFGVEFSNPSSTAYKRLEKTALDAGGQVYSAQSQSELTAALTNAVNDINRQASNSQSMAASASSSSKLMLYKPTYNPKADGFDRWSGDVTAYVKNPLTGNTTPVTGPGALGRLENRAVSNSNWWDSSRVVLSSVVAGDDGAATTRKFAFRDAAIQTNASGEQYWNVLGADNTARTNVVNFVRGKEGVAGLRSRSNGSNFNLLGDIIGSTAQIVAKPDSQSLDPDFNGFLSTHASRSMLFVGANDGMLHGFYGGDVNSGSIKPMDEVMAYVPSKSYYNLRTLVEPTYGQVASAHPHTYFVNGPLQMNDVRESAGNWHTYLMGSMGQGGQGVFTLDVTSMSQFSEGAPSTTIKWEFTDRHDPSVGYQFGRPLMTAVRTNTTDKVVQAAIFTSGFDNHTADPAQQTSRVDSNNSPALFVVNQTTGALIRKITLPSSPTDYSKNLTLSAPAGGDIGWDGIIDFVYVGDNQGNLWRFNLTSDDSSQWSSGSAPFFKAKNGSNQNQPIVQRPTLTPVFDKDVDGNIDYNSPVGNMVVFGTGRFLYASDKTDNTVQSLYGVLDRIDALNNSSTLTRADLQAQTIHTGAATTTVSAVGKFPGEYRTSTMNAVSLSGANKGWVIDLPNTGERNASAPYFNQEADVVLFASAIPVSTSQCSAGGDGWLYGVDPQSGQPKRGFIDVNLSGYFDAGDDLTFNTTPTAVTRPASAYHLTVFPGELTRGSTESTIAPGLPSTVSSQLSGITAPVGVREGNSSGIFRMAKVGAASGVTTGASVPYSTPTGGSIMIPCQGSLCVKDIPTGGKPPSTVSVERVTWRELIQ